jgi:hypothetical protein
MAKHDDIPKTDAPEIKALIKRLKRLIFGPGSDKCAVAGNTAEKSSTDRGIDPDQRPGSDSCPGIANSLSAAQKPKRPWRGRKGASAYTGALRCSVR